MEKNKNRVSKKICGKSVSSMPSKSERHGWPSLSEMKPRKLVDIIGEGEMVKRERYALIVKTKELLIP